MFLWDGMWREGKVSWGLAMTNNATVYAACCGQLGADLAVVPDGRSQHQKSPSTANLGLII